MKKLLLIFLLTSLPLSVHAESIDEVNEHLKQCEPLPAKKVSVERKGFRIHKLTDNVFNAITLGGGLLIDKLVGFETFTVEVSFTDANGKITKHSNCELINYFRDNRIIINDCDSNQAGDLICSYPPDKSAINVMDSQHGKVPDVITTPEKYKPSVKQE